MQVYRSLMGFRKMQYKTLQVHGKQISGKIGNAIFLSRRIAMVVLSLLKIVEQ